MSDRVGTGLLSAGIVALMAGIVMADGNVMRASFWGWRVLFQAGILTVCLGVYTIFLEPDTTIEIIVATGIGVLGQLSVSLVILVAGGGEFGMYTLLVSVVPLLPMAVGYMAGALHTVPELPVRRRLGIDVVAALLGLVVWIAGYIFILIGFDTTGEGGIHPGLLFMVYVILLLVNLVVGGLMYALWRLFGPKPPTKPDRPVTV